MPVSNYNYVCFRCRTAIRHPQKSTSAPKCLACGEECFGLGSKVEIPRRTELRKWHALELECQRRTGAAADRRNLQKVRRQHFVEQEIRRLRELPENRDRNRHIKKLQAELQRIAPTASQGEKSSG